MIKATSSIVKVNSKYTLDIIMITGINTVHITVTNNEKYHYEKDYQKKITRKMSYQGVISFDNQGIHLGELQGVSQFLENFKKDYK
jgi:hypothetical protein